jgi:hypothetical protein
MPETRWTRGEIIAALTLVVGVAAFFVPEVRNFLGLPPLSGASSPQLKSEVIATPSSDLRPLPVPTRDTSAPPADIGKPSPPSPSCLQAIINDPDHYTNVRSGPAATYPIINRIAEQQVFCVNSRSGKWWRITTPEGVRRFMHYDRIRILH